MQSNSAHPEWIVGNRKLWHKSCQALVNELTAEMHFSGFVCKSGTCEKNRDTRAALKSVRALRELFFV